MNIVVMNECGIYRIALRVEQSSFGSGSCFGKMDEIRYRGTNPVSPDDCGSICQK